MQFSSYVEQALSFREGESSDAAERASVSLAARLAKIQDLKAFPAVAQKVMQILSEPDLKIMSLAKAVRDDPALGAKVMRAANSAFYSRGRQIASFDQAVVRLGRSAVRDLVAAVATMELFADSKGIGRRFRDHCAATASVSQVLVQRLSPSFSEGAFLAGLLHDIGKLLLISAGEGLYDVMSTDDLVNPDRAHLVERGALGFDHAVLAGQILWHWQIPAPVPKVVAWHHQPSLAYGDPGVDVLTSMVRIADHLGPAITADDSTFEKFAESFAEGPDCRFAGVSASELSRMLPELRAAKSDSLALFS